MATARLRGFLLFELATFVVASLTHAGFLIEGYRHQQASIAEALIAAVLLGGVLLAWRPSRVAYRAGIFAQTFALLGVLVGLFFISLGVGPQTVPDVVYHVGIALVLLLGLREAFQTAVV